MTSESILRAASGDCGDNPTGRRGPVASASSRNYNARVIIDSIYPTVATDDFARRFSQRGGNLMWLLGAGASAAAGIPTAWDMIWAAVRRELQTFIDGIGS